jgi:DNA-binding transcriptional ArsR family regulator
MAAMALVAQPKDRRKTLDLTTYFHYSGNMETVDSLRALSTLAHDSRLRIFRLLVEQGPGGLPAGEIGRDLGLPSATLSFHIKELATAGLVSARQRGRYIHYSTDFERMRELVAFLSENCCGSASADDCSSACAPDCPPPQRGVFAAPKPIVRPKRRAA